jgi:hypothetical protein
MAFLRRPSGRVEEGHFQKAFLAAPFPYGCVAREALLLREAPLLLYFS